MNRICISIVLLFSTITMSSNSFSKDKFPVMENRYFGEQPPSLIPKLFAPDIVSTEHRDYSAFFSSDMTEFYFTRRDNSTKKWSLHRYIYEDNDWKKAGVEPRVGRPIISHDGNIMHLGKKYRERTNSGWSEIKSLGSSYEDIRIMKLTSSLQGTYFLDEGTREGKGILRYSRLVDGVREKPKPLSKVINSGTWNAHPYIAPDESYIMWDGERDGGYGDNDIYISFKQHDGTWGEAVNLGKDINTDAQEAGAYITPDGKYLFFNRTGDVYWVSAKVIEGLRD